MGYKNAHCFSKRGFALAEIVVSLFIVTMAIVLVGGLGQQVMQLSKSTRQVGARIEFQSKINSITKNPNDWIDQLRSLQVFAGCLPDKLSMTANSEFTCPSVANSLRGSNTELGKLAGSQLHVVSTPLVDLMGDPIAGTLDAPVFLDNSGRPCSENNCPLKSIGYFMRSNPDTNSNPGSVRFVIELSKNDLVVSTGAPPFKKQYFSVDIGTDWEQSGSSTNCPSGSIKVGYLTNGTAACINPTTPCSSGQVALGINPDGTQICRNMPSNCPNGALINSSTNELECANIPQQCGTNQLLLGYVAGTGEPMCSGSNFSCPNGKLNVGITINEGNMKAQCVALEDCSGTNNNLAFDGTKFVCKGAATADACPPQNVVVGVDELGKLKCEPKEKNVALGVSCDPGFFMAGIKADGTLDCKAERAPASEVVNNPATGKILVDTFHTSEGSPYLGGSPIGIIPVGGTKVIDIPLGNTDLARTYISTSYLYDTHTFDWQANFTFDVASGNLKFSMSGFHFAKSGELNIKNTWKVFASDYGENPHDGATARNYPSSPRGVKAYRTVELYHDTAAKVLKMKLSAHWYHIDSYQVVVDKYVNAAPGTGGGGSSYVDPLLADAASLGYNGFPKYIRCSISSQLTYLVLNGLERNAGYGCTNNSKCAVYQNENDFNTEQASVYYFKGESGSGKTPGARAAVVPSSVLTCPAQLSLDGSGVAK